MKTKTVITVSLLAVFVSFTAIPSSAWAGSPRSHRMEGVAIGIGAAIIGTALISAYQHANQPAEVHYYYHPEPPAPAGYWETQQEWVPPEYRKQWNPGHYDRRGRWTAGRWIQIETRPGYWMEKRVWVPQR